MFQEGDLICFRPGQPHEFEFGFIIERTFETLPPGTNKILVYKVLVDSIIINVPMRWMEHVNTNTLTQEN